MIMACSSQEKKSNTFPFTNDLIHETSPYLLQHAHNPVHWHAWNEKTLALAQKERKLILISIGYAACHWCHVMEHESFENEEVAKLMNDNFICIKVDREERPDVDQVYMDAVQLLNGSGGWPLNAIALPDTKPFWGGTYFPKERWVEVLTQIAGLWKENPEKIKAYAQQLTAEVRNKNILIKNTTTRKVSSAQLKKILVTWRKYFDTEKGGYRQAPKFPMPNNYHFLLRHAVQTHDADLLDYVNTTLTQMAYGGIYDQIGGGFARYATDTKWHIPHFEKMLYDNAQLVSLYSDAYLITRNPLYKKVVYQTLEFVQRELTDPVHGAFYSSLDADSNSEAGNLEEGAYYTWTIPEIKKITGADFPLCKDYYNINTYGLWADGKYVLIRRESDTAFALSHHISFDALTSKIQSWQKKMLKVRQKRARPRLDNKVLTAWNALMLKAYTDAYRVFGEEKFLQAAQKNAKFLKNTMLQENGSLRRNFKDDKVSINAYLEDYALTIDAFIALYEMSAQEEYLLLAKQLTGYTISHFYDRNSQLFFFTSDIDSRLITRKIEWVDNVIPASNSTMAMNLFKLSHFFENRDYQHMSYQMLQAVLDKAAAYPVGYSNWLQLGANFSGKFYEIAITGKQAEQRLQSLNKFYIPNKILAVSEKASDLPLLQHRFNATKTLLYICVDNSCRLPYEQVDQVVQQIDTTY